MTGKPLDTTSEAWQVQRDALARMTGEERVSIAMELSEAVRELQIAGILARNPGWTRADAIWSLLPALMDRSRP